ncbi:unnamed protein product [Arctia plantaginis]|uniref:Uncharacterized protein n=1 Tax=Arctia plantaginis TaxID=874455 RepID=A0A8S1B3K4_ARCPL|nr:unnamed protein product [Arctia plantaginis]
MSSKHDEHLRRISNLKTERREDKKCIQPLQDSLENLERKSRACGIEIRNVPKTSGEIKEILNSLVVKIGKPLDVNIDRSSIKDVYGINSKDNSNPIVIEYETVVCKNFIEGVKGFNKNKKKTRN